MQLICVQTPNLSCCLAVVQGIHIPAIDQFMWNMHKLYAGSENYHASDCVIFDMGIVITNDVTYSNLTPSHPPDRIYYYPSQGFRKIWFHVLTFHHKKLSVITVSWCDSSSPLSCLWWVEHVTQWPWQVFSIYLKSRIFTVSILIIEDAFLLVCNFLYCFQTTNDPTITASWAAKLRRWVLSTECRRRGGSRTGPAGPRCAASATPALRDQTGKLFKPG